MVPSLQAMAPSPFVLEDLGVYFHDFYEKLKKNTFDLDKKRVNDCFVFNGGGINATAGSEQGSLARLL